MLLLYIPSNIAGEKIVTQTFNILGPVHMREGAPRG